MAPARDPSGPLENPLERAGNADGSAPATPPWWRNLLNPKWIALFVVLSFLLPCMVYASARLGTLGDSVGDVEGEVSLGEFRFLGNRHEQSPIVAASFRLHLALIPETDALARARLVSHKYRVKQGVEQLLRQAHGGDFEDPSLGDFRRQLQEQINETLGVRAVADVIVTGLTLEVSEKDTGSDPSGEVAGSLPWSD